MNLQTEHEKIKMEFLNEQYKTTLQYIFDMELQNEWLSSLSGKKEVGEEKAKEVIEKNLKSLKGQKEKLRFLGTKLYGKEKENLKKEKE